ncbi:MAG: 1,6-anhydro-N-acetylmuramyl-L-alanine amidase AmpD [Burkholderiales bacterium]
MTDLPHANALWHDGRYRFARWLASPNFGARPPSACVDLIVLHSISLPPGVYGGAQVQQFFTNQLPWEQHPYFKQIEGLEVSAHFYIQRSGEIWQFVSCDDRAWHAGQSSYRGRDNCNDDSIGIELEGSPGEPFERAQYEALQALCPALCQRYPIAHIAGHEHVAPGRKDDPGSGFDWALLQQTLGLDAHSLPKSVRKAA